MHKMGAAGLDTLRFTIPSDFAAGREVQKQIMDSLEKRGFNCDCTFAIRLALEEALVNAIKHGNRLDPSKKVHVEVRFTRGQAEITITDEGPGFNRQGVPDPTQEENLEKCCGRGIHLMEHYMNKVEWSKGGRCVRLIKKNQNTAAPGK
jgi:serine/threonine-protein kinase RsbW